MNPPPEQPSGTDTGCRPRWALNNSSPAVEDAAEAVARLRPDGPDPTDADTTPVDAGAQSPRPDGHWRRLFN
jgi:hypothetical protein